MVVSTVFQFKHCTIIRNKQYHGTRKKKIISIQALYDYKRCGSLSFCHLYLISIQALYDYKVL